MGKGFQSNATAMNVFKLSDIRMRRLRLDAPRAERAHDERIFPRITASDRMFVQVVVCPGGRDLEGTTLSCTAADMSPTGVGFQSARSLPVGTLVDMWIDVPARPGKFFLSGEVRWSTLSDPNYSVGVELRSGAATDIVEWRDYHLEAMVQSR